MFNAKAYGETISAHGQSSKKESDKATETETCIQNKWQVVTKQKLGARTWVRMDISSDDNSFHNFTVLGKNACRWAEVLVLGRCSAIQLYVVIFVPS